MPNKYLSVLSGCIEDNYLYVVDIDTWLFLRYDIYNGECVLLADIQRQETRGKLCWVERILHIGREFVLIIRNYNGIVIVDDEYGVSYYELDPELGTNNSFYCMDACFLDGYIYILPGYLGGRILVFDYHNRKFVKEIPLMAIMGEKLEEYCTKNIWRYEHGQNKAEMKFCIEGTNIVATLDIRTLVAEKRLIEGTSGIIMICGQVDNQLIIDSKNDLLFYDFDTNKVEKISNYLCANSLGDYLDYNLIFQVGDMIWKIQEKTSTIEIIKNKTAVSKKNIPEESKLIYEVRQYNGRFATAKESEGRIILFPFSTNGIIIIEKLTLELLFVETIVPPEYILAKTMHTTDIINEDENFSLEYYVKILKQTNYKVVRQNFD